MWEQCPINGTMENDSSDLEGQINEESANYSLDKKTECIDGRLERF